jgi:hypothetical protein
MRRVTLMTASLACACAMAGAGEAAVSPVQRLADRFAPVVMLKTQLEPCGRGEPYRPVPVDVVLGRPDVSLFRGARGSYRLLRRGPVAADLYGRGGDAYLDLPGHPVSGRCGYQRWFARIGRAAPNAVYAHVTTERGHPRQLALQYWLYYVFNDYNDKHESDWEMIQLHFDAATATEALRTRPGEILYSQHQGAERASWDDDKLERSGPHPFTYPGAGSHANYYRPALWLGRSAGEGIGCDDSTSPSTRIDPRALLLPARVAGPSSNVAWLAYAGHWGQRERGFNDGPFGPNVKLQWRQPFTWAEQVERDHSFSVPGTAHDGLDASDLFCSAIPAVSEGLDAFYASPWVAPAAIAALLALVAVAVACTRWRPTSLRPIEQRRAAGQIVCVTFRVYRLDWRTLFVVSAIVLPLTFLAALVVHLLSNAGNQNGLVQVIGRESALFVHVDVLVLAVVDVIALGIAVGATTIVVSSLRLGEEHVGVAGALRRALRRATPLAAVLLRVVGIPLFLALTVVGLPVAVWYLGRTAVAVPACVVEGLGARASVRRSKQLVGRHFWRVSALTTLTVAAALFVGPLAGAIVLLTTDLPLLLVNAVAMVVSAASMPFVGIVLTLLFLDLRCREHEPAASPAPAPVPAC